MSEQKQKQKQTVIKHRTIIPEGIYEAQIEQVMCKKSERRTKYYQIAYGVLIEGTDCRVPVYSCYIKKSKIDSPFNPIAKFRAIMNILPSEWREERTVKTRLEGRYVYIEIIHREIHGRTYAEVKNVIPSAYYEEE